MFDSPRFRSAAFVCLAAFTLNACGKKDDAPPAGDLAVDGGVLTYVPADTPYVIASGAPFPDDVIDKIEPIVERVMVSYQTVLREVMKDARAEYEAELEINGEEVDVDSEKMQAVMEEVIAMMSLEELRKAGIDDDSRFAFYGNGLLPVIRFEVSDAKLFDAAIARLEAAAGEEMDTATIDGNSYRYVGDDDGSIIVGLFGNHVVMTLAPGEFGEAELKSLLGLTPPAKNIVDAGRLSGIVAEYDLTNSYVGFFDTVRMASIFLGDASPLDQAVLDSGDFDPEDISDVCREEILEVAGIVPLVVMGYDEVSTEAFGGKVIIRVRDDLATAMTAFGAAVPGLGFDPGGFGSFGMSFNLLAMRNFYEARLDAIDQDPFKCEFLQELQAAFAEGRSMLQQPVPPMAYGFRGINIVVDDIRDLDLSNPAPPEEIDATVIVAMDDAPSLPAMGAMFSPELAALDLKPDGKPVALDVQQVQMMGYTAYAAMTNDAIAVSVGEGASDRAAESLTAESSQPPLSMGVAMNASLYYEFMASGLTDAGSGGDDGSPAARAAMREAMLASSELYDRITFGMRFTDKGIVLESRATLVD